MSNRREIEEMLESCRPGSDDLLRPEMARAAEALRNDPELAELHARMQRHDAAIAAAFRQVTIPVGLEQRLLERLAAAGPTAAARSADGAVPSTTVSDPAAVQPPEVLSADSPRVAPAVRPRARAGNRRWWLAAAAVAACATVGILGVWWNRPAELSADQLATLAREWTETVVSDSAASWQPFRETDFPETRWRPHRWRVIPTDLHPRTVVFDFALRSGERLLLFQLPLQNERFALPPVPYQRLSTSGKWNVGAWLEDGVLFVAVTDNPRRLDSFKLPFTAT